MRLLLIILAVITSVAGSAQILSPDQLNARPDMRKRIYKDGFIDFDEKLSVDSQYFNQQRNYIAYPPLREADVLWSKTVWRDIEVGEKLNLPLYYPLVNDQPVEDRQNLFDIIQEAYRANLLQGFNGKDVDCEFKTAWRIGYMDSLAFGKSCTVPRLTETGEQTGIVDTIISKYAADQVVKYRLKEYWYFDKQRSQLMVKIVGIMPFVWDQKGCEPDDPYIAKPTAWFYFPEFRAILANKEVYNRKNETVRLTFDDIFIKRYFSSHIVREDNVYNRSIEQAGYKGMEALMEAEAIKEKIFNFEHDLWDF